MMGEDYVSVALTLQAAIDLLIQFADGKTKEFPYHQVREAVDRLIGTSDDLLAQYDIMIAQQKSTVAWIEFLVAMKARMLHEQRMNQ